jgi:hypothetical protein
VGGEAGDRVDAIEKRQQIPPDIMLTDIKRGRRLLSLLPPESRSGFGREPVCRLAGGLNNSLDKSTNGSHSFVPLKRVMAVDQPTKGSKCRWQRRIYGNRNRSLFFTRSR